MTLPHNATPAATAVVATLQTRIDTMAASIVTAVRMCGACCGRVCVLAGVVVQQQGAWRRPTSLNFAQVYRVIRVNLESSLESEILRTLRTPSLSDNETLKTIRLRVFGSLGLWHTSDSESLRV